MANEVDSFVLKLKNLWKAGRDAKLTIETVAGEATVTLSVRGLPEPQPGGPAQQEHYLSQLVSQSRNGPARQRRREKREAARQAVKATLKDGLDADAVEETVEEEAVVAVVSEEPLEP